MKDSDTAQDYIALKAMDKKRKDEYKATKLSSDIAKVKATGLTIESKNDGEHWIIHKLYNGSTQLVDYWPSTQRWRFRNGKFKGFGVDDLLKFLV